MKRDALSPSTRTIHTSSLGPKTNQPVTPPIHLSSTFESESVEEQVRVEQTKADTFYTRYGNPTLTIAETMVAELETAEAAAVFGSGMAAITTTLLGLLKSGDHAVFQREIYGGVHRFATEFLPSMGVDVSFVDAEDGAGFASAMRDDTCVVYMESPTNPTLKLVDIESVAKAAQKRNVVTLIDSTFATPMNCRPVELGVDGVLHSATKYLGGHSDLLAGVLAGSQALVDRTKSTLRVLGGILDPHAAYLLARGLKTLGMRVEQHGRNAMVVAELLAGHEKVRAVHYPFLPSHPQHALARKQMASGGGVLSFELDGLGAAKRFADAVEIVRVAPSLGGVESLLSIPCLTSHAMLSKDQRAKAGIADGLVRLALGIEASEDLVEDIAQALAKV